jgi:peptidoglycan/LPS O-acetylase OafA/YrhL
VHGKRHYFTVICGEFTQLTTVPTTISYRPDIQGLRAIAIALVLLAHSNVPGFAGGYVGVDVFFVLSGYLITGLLVKERLSTGGVRYGRFLARRLKRLLPALLTMLIVVIVAASLLLSAYETRMQSGSFLFSATWTSNFFFAFVDRDYFSALQTADLFLHTWSLGIEEQFYVVWPWLVSSSFLLIKSNARANRERNALLCVLTAIFAGSFLLSLYWSKTQPLLSFYMMPSRGWQFALGAAIFVWFHDFGHEQQAKAKRSTSLLAGLPIGVMGILLIVGSAVLLDSEVTYPGYFALIPSLGATLVIAAGRNGRRTGLSGILASKQFVWLGDRSYSLYLWHWPVFVFGNSLGLSNTAIGLVSLVGISVLFAMLSYRFIELPFWRGQFSRAKPVRTILLSVLAIVAAIGVADSMKRNIYGIPTETMTTDSYNPRLDAPPIYAAGLGCDTWYLRAELVPCRVGAENAKLTAVLLGDSIGAQWFSIFPEIFSAPDWQVIVLTKSACAIVDETYYYDKVGADYEVCTEWRNSALEYIDAIKPDIVFVGSAAVYDFSESQWVDGTSRVLARLTAAANQVVIIPGTPALTFNGPSCLHQPYRFSYRLRDSNRECEEAKNSSRDDEIMAYLQRSANDFASAQVLNLSDLVCPDRRCAARREDGITVFRDEQHLTMSFVNSQIPVIHDRLLAMGLETQYMQTHLESMNSN